MAPVSTSAPKGPSADNETPDNEHEETGSVAAEGTAGEASASTPCEPTRPPELSNQTPLETQNSGAEPESAKNSFGNFIGWVSSSLPAAPSFLRRSETAKAQEEDKNFAAGFPNLSDPYSNEPPSSLSDTDPMTRLESHLRTTNPSGPAAEALASKIAQQTGTASNSPTTGTKNVPHPRNMVLPIIDLAAQAPVSENIPHDLLAAHDIPPVAELGFFARVRHSFNNIFYPPGPIKPKEPERWLDHLTRTLYDVKHVVVVGVHGWFPIKLVLRIVGEPTGTSPRFVNMMSRAVHDFLFERGVNLPPDSITGIALEGPGRIDERTEALYAQLVKHKEAIWRADMVFFAAHSQGSVVSAHLLSKLISDGILDPERTRTCLLAMAGVSHGPFPFLKNNVLVQYFEQQAARELFEFCEDPEKDPKSVGAKYRDSLDHILSHGVRMVAVGSWFDQVVPLYSALLHRYTHPLVFRAVHISAADYSPDFLTSLVTFAVRLRNRGIWDHGLLVHLSEVVAGSLISGTQGHSSVYEEADVYSIAVQWLLSNHAHVSRRPRSMDPDDMVWTSQAEMNLRPPRPAQETNRAPYEGLVLHPPPPIHFSTGRINPYHLPWVMHELVTAPEIVGDDKLRRELKSLIEQFRRWAPPDDRKAWKELRWRLEALATVPTSKL